MSALLLPVLLASLAGSLHCAAMCGGFVCAVSAPGRPLLSQAAWHAGRGVAYVLLGLTAGALGNGLERLLAPSGLDRAAAVAAGVLLVVWGAAALLGALGVRTGAGATASPLAGPLGAGLRAVRDWPPLPRGAAMGALTAALPCGWLWAFVATAGGTGSVLRGGLVMLTFWFGTLPMLAALGLALGRVLSPLHQRLPLVTASAMIVVGLLTVAGRFRSHADAAGHAHCAAPASGSTHVGR